MDTGIQVYKDARVQGYTEIGGGGYRDAKNCLAIEMKKTFSYRNTVIQGYTDT